MFWTRSSRFVSLAIPLAVLSTGVVRADLVVTPPATNTAQTLDQWHDQMDAQLQRVARKLDSFFKRADDPESTGKSTGRVRLMLNIQDAETPSLNAAFSGKLALPCAEERLHLFVDNIKRGALPGAEDPTTSDNTLQAGLRFWLLRELRSRLSFESGVKFRGIPDPFGQVEFQYERKLDGWLGRFTQDAFYYAKERAGELTQVDVERAFRNQSVLRSTTAAQYTEESNGVEFEQTLLYDLPLHGRGRNLIPSASVFAHRNGSFLMDDYRVNITYRTSFFRPWLILEVTPQIEFPRERDYTFTPSLRIGFEIWLGSLPEDR